MTEYTSEFFQSIQSGSQSSAAAVVPLVVKLLKPQTVIDIGCGTAGWLSIFRKHGLDILGVDGDYVDAELIEIDRESFHYKDISKSFNLGKTFDLVMSLEVAEHLAEESADQFIDNLVNHGKIILFSAAVPMQGGTHHVNEQWPQYWTAKFKTRGYLCIDYFRFKIWNDPEVEWWYAQNLLLYVKEDELTNNPALSALKSYLTEAPLPLIHPRSYIEKLTWAQKQLQEAQELARSPGHEQMLSGALEQVAGRDLVRATVKRLVQKASSLLG